MAAIRARLLAAVAKRENIVSGLLLGTFVALCFRSSEQQREIDALEAEKSSLRAAVTAMSSSIWSWRQDLFALAADAAKDTSSTRKPYIPLPRLRAIYGEEEPPSPSDLPQSATAPTQQDVLEWNKNLNGWEQLLNADLHAAASSP